MSTGLMGNGSGGGGAVSTSSNTSRPFATVPSTDEANHALSSVQQLVESSPSMLQQPGDSQDFSDAFCFLKTEPSIVQRIVVSLTCDKLVWEAVMNNEAVRELKDSLNQAARSFFGLAPRRTILGRDVAESSDGSIPLLDFLKMFFVKMKAIAIAVVEKTIGMASNLFQFVKSSLLLSVLVILVIVVDQDLLRNIQTDGEVSNHNVSMDA